MIPTNQQAYSVAQGTSQIPAFVFRDRDPTVQDITYDLYSGWVNTITNAIWYLEAFIPSNGFITAQWRAVGPIVVATTGPTSSDYLYPIGQTWIDTVGMVYWGLVNVTGTTATWEDLSSGVAAGILTITGNTGGSVMGDGSRNVNLIGSSGVTVTGNPGTNTLTVSLSGGSAAIDSVGVDANTGPGTNPVLPNGSGEIFVTGGQVAAGTTANVIRTDSLSANTYTVQVQRATTAASSTLADNGVSHFNSADFTIDNNGFVSISSPGSKALTQVNIQTFTSSGTYTPTSGMKYCVVEVVGGGGSGGGASASQGIGEPFSIAGGGGGGAYSKGIFNASSIGSSQTVTIGSGGTGAIGAGSPGGTTSMGTLISVGGGGGGTTLSLSGPDEGNFTAGAAGGTVITAGSYSITGGNGEDGVFNPFPGPTSSVFQSGRGGSSSLSNSNKMNSILAVINTTGSSNGSSGISYGGGGSGGVAFASSVGGTATATGGNGANGICIITEYI